LRPRRLFFLVSSGYPRDLHSFPTRRSSDLAGNFPSTVKAHESLAADATPNEFFNDAPTGAILAERAQGVVAQFKGADDSVIPQNVFGPALSALDRGETDTQGAWDQAIKLLKELVG